ncbi:two component transcriptional regulator, LuxR family [Verrucomicrobium sp. GAS474]|uniref:response regulator n=1 Tax=Verrucomicrobium sp. GAS474 TaxID=1882831 RepID=UPI00087C605A|nr:response regulator transcription factor [Verrucomicrobium sp. GAS474]SDU20634.1 two component transcriptional regulator, LuxR family [Verrucomicrobium sp. GAS474]
MSTKQGSSGKDLKDSKDVKDAKDSKKTRVLVVDDQTMLRQLIVAVLKPLDHFTVIGEASNGEEAIQKSLELQPDMLVLDVILPKIPGAEVLRQILPKMPALRVLAISAHDDPALLKEMLACGAHGFVEKSAPLDIFSEALREVAEGKSFFGPRITEVLREHLLNPTHDRPHLTTREREIIQLVAQGLSSKEIASQLNVSARTVENHRANIMNKLNIRDAVGLTRYAIKAGLVSPA